MRREKQEPRWPVNRNQPRDVKQRLLGWEGRQAGSFSSPAAAVWLLERDSRFWRRCLCNQRLFQSLALQKGKISCQGINYGLLKSVDFLCPCLPSYIYRIHLPLYIYIYIFKVRMFIFYVKILKLFVYLSLAMMGLGCRQGFPSLWRAGASPWSWWEGFPCGGAGSLGSGLTSSRTLEHRFCSYGGPA